MRIGVFGGTFNPVHYGHLRAAEEAAEALELQRVLFVPAGSPPLKSKGLASTEARLRMVEMAIAGNPLFELSSIEAAKPGKSFSVDTLSELSRERGELVFILGTDAFRDIHLWHEPERLIELADFAVLSRSGYPIDLMKDMPYAAISPEEATSLALGQSKMVTGRLKSGRRFDILPITPMGVSATEIRKRIGEGRSVRYLLPESVESFIMSNSLYKRQIG